MSNRRFIGKLCKHCGKKFRAERFHARYCSPECGWKFRNKRRAIKVRKALAHLEDTQMMEAPHGA